MNHFGCILAATAFILSDLPTTKFRIWLFFGYCIAARRLLFTLIPASRGLLLAIAWEFLFSLTRRPDDVVILLRRHFSENKNPHAMASNKPCDAAIRINNKRRTCQRTKMTIEYVVSA